MSISKSAKSLLLTIALSVSAGTAVSQDKLYPNTFSLSEVQLLDGPFKHAMDLNVDVLLQYDTDRLLAPFLQEAGLPKKAEYFPNWAGLDGHVGGHYISALAIHYAATGNEACKERLDYVLAELKRCQDKNGNGYVGGVPDSDLLWGEVKKGNHGFVHRYWVPWYNIHKTYAGLRDAWMYAGSEMAKEMFIKLCDWGCTITASLSDAEMEQMCGQEFGGMNEVYADAYQITGDKKYLDAARRFAHHWLLDSMAKGVDNLDNRHANTQVPKVVGHARTAEMYQLAGQPEEAAYYQRASEFFWETVINTRSLSFGGNSRREHFASADDCKSYVDDREGPESCNTNNMLKLTQNLFRMTGDVRYADYYERAMFNHILSTQHPEHGGYVYFTPARPAHYRVYSAPNSGMWCCVGTGMENHGKYGEFIYTHTGDELYVNLFVASRLVWKEKKFSLTQETSFPNEETVRFTVNSKKSQKLKINIRCPWWVKPGEMKVICNGRDYATGAQPSSYIAIERKWKKGDVIEVTMPMSITVEELPNVPNYISIMRGPILLGARMGTYRLDGLVADDGRWAHIAHGPLVSLFDTPFLIGDRSEIVEKLQHMQPVPGKPMHFTVPGLFEDKYQDLELEPFSAIHDSRYMMYWLSMSKAEYDDYKQKMRDAENQKLALDARTVDAVSTAEQQPEVDHQMKAEGSKTGHFQNEGWRDATNGGYFSYNMDTKGNEELKLMVRYWGNENGNRSFDILIDGHVLTSENIVGKWGREAFVNAEYAIPTEWLKGKLVINVRFQSHPGTVAGGVYHIRLIK